MTILFTLSAELKLGVGANTCRVAWYPSTVAKLGIVTVNGYKSLVDTVIDDVSEVPVVSIVLSTEETPKVDKSEVDTFNDT